MMVLNKTRLFLNRFIEYLSSSFQLWTTPSFCLDFLPGISNIFFFDNDSDGKPFHPPLINAIQLRNYFVAKYIQNDSSECKSLSAVHFHFCSDLHLHSFFKTWELFYLLLSVVIHPDYPLYPTSTFASDDNLTLYYDL